MAPQINAFRAELGLPPVRRIIDSWWHSPRRVIGLFPEWFAPPQEDWPPQVRLTDFPLYDESGTTPLPAELERFLQDGSPPIVFTPGSAMWQANSFFEESARAAASIGRRAVLLSRHADHLPARLPPGVIHVPYAPFSQLLPRSAAMVHHGGIGTAAQAMAAGIPQLITPFTHDQPDNAQRLENLGIARTISSRRYRAAKIANLLKELLADATIGQRCREIASRFETKAGIPRACDLIEEAALTSYPHPASA